MSLHIFCNVWFLQLMPAKPMLLLRKKVVPCYSLNEFIKLVEGARDFNLTGILT